MKSLKLKDYSIGGLNATTIQLLEQIIDHSGGGGITTSEQRRRMKLLDIIDSQKNNDSINFEDADFKHLSELVEGMVWAISNSITRQFLKDIDGVQ